MSHETNRIRTIFPKTPGYNSWMKRVISINAHSDNKTAQYRLEVIKFYQQFGMKATLAAFPVKRSTVFLWQQKLKESKGRLSSLIPQSTKPKKVNQMRTHPLVLAEICRLRRKHYRLGKHKLYPLIKRYCQTVMLSCSSESTIGKIIKRNNIFYDKITYGYHDPNRKKPERKKKTRVLKAPKPEAGGYVELDTIETIIDGIRRYTITAIDVRLKVSFAQTFKSKHARNSVTVLKALALVLPVSIHTVQTDNGSEFEGDFDEYCQSQNIKHKWTYPNSPKINGVIERFNRSIQEEWLDMYQDEMIELNLINRRIKEYLSFYHHDRIHESLADQTPADNIGYNINYNKSPICV